MYSLRVKSLYFVDEFLDTKPLQTLLIIKLIGIKSTTIVIIGDIAQSIYSFQGARPSQFANFSTDGDRQLSDYVIKGNRRSTENVVKFCNFLRKSDGTVIQNSIRPYENREKIVTEAIPIRFLIGDSG